MATAGDTRAASSAARPELTVVLCTRNGASTIARQLDALMAQDWDDGSFEVVVVDNGSTDGTASVVARYVDADPERVRLVPAPERAGLSYARNVGVEHARGDSVVFCDDDDEVAPGWVAAMGEALRHHEVVASHMEYRRLSDPRALVGRADYQSRGVEHLFGLPVVNGASGWRVSLWRALGGNDVEMDFTGEDLDMALRAHLRFGVKPVFCEGAVYHCRRRGGVRATFTQARRYGRAHVVLYRRYGRGRVDARAESRRALLGWWWLARSLPQLATGRVSPLLWTWRLGLRVGRLEGSVRELTWWP